MILGKKDAREGKDGIWELETPNPCQRPKAAYQNAKRPHITPKNSAT